MTPRARHRWNGSDEVLWPMPYIEHADGLREFSILPYQEAFLDATAIYLVFCGGVGTGKTTVGGMKVIREMIDHPGLVVAAISPTFAMSDEITQPKLEELEDAFFRLNGFRLWRKKQVSRRKWTMFNGSVIRFFSAQKPQRLIGQTAGLMWLDEESSYDDHATIIRIIRARRRGQGSRQVIVTTTPAGAIGLVGEAYEAEQRGGDPRYKLFQVPSWENPFLAADYLDEMKRTYSQALWEQEVEGKVRSGIDRVLPEYNPAIHIIPWDAKRELATGAWDVVCGVDWTGGAADGAVVWVAVKRDHTLTMPKMVIFDEHIERGSNEKLIQQGIIQKMNEWLPPVAICPDPADLEQVKDLRRLMFQRSRKTRVFYELERERRLVSRGVEFVARSLMSASGQASLFIAQSVADDKYNRPGGNGICQALDNWRIRHGKPHDDNYLTHIVDALRYVFYNLHRIGYRINLVIDPGTGSTQFVTRSRADLASLDAAG